MKRILSIGCCFLFCVIVACNEYSDVDCDSWDYSDCIGEKPLIADVEILTTIEEGSPNIPLVVIEGEFGNLGDTVYIDTVGVASTIIILPLDQNYVAIATYLKNGKLIKAIDGKSLRKNSTSVCDTTCWYIKGDKLDVRLRDI